MKKLMMIFCMFIFAKTVFAVSINQVLYDPISTESGGEAIELYNPDSFNVDISNWVIATETSDKDVVLPENILIKAKGYFLIADEGWSESKDNPDWKNADYEGKMTLGNKNSGIALKDGNGIIADAVGWGDQSEIKNGLYEGEPALQVSAGNSLLRIQDTQNNIDDFIEQTPWFSDDNSIELDADVENGSIEEIYMEDDDLISEEYQINPYAGAVRKIRVTVKSQEQEVFVEFLNQTAELKKINSTHYEGFIELDYFLAPDTYLVNILAGDSSEAIEFEYLSLSQISVGSKKVKFNARKGKENPAKTKVIIKNSGNVDLRFSFSGKDLESGENSIGINNLKYSVDGDDYRELNDSENNNLILLPAEEKEISFSLFVPEESTRGSYRTFVKVKVIT